MTSKLCGPHRTRTPTSLNWSNVHRPKLQESDTLLATFTLRLSSDPRNIAQNRLCVANGARFALLVVGPGTRSEHLTLALIMFQRCMGSGHNLSSFLALAS